MLFAAAPLLAGVRNLSVGETARLLDFYVVLPGMLLLIPVFLPEQDKAIRDLIRARYTSMGSIYLVRIFLNVAVMAALTGVFLLGLERGGCDFPFGNYFMASLAGMVFLGGFGAAAFALSDNPVIGYMASLGYYLFWGRGKISGELVSVLPCFWKLQRESISCCYRSCASCGRNRYPCAKDQVEDRSFRRMLANTIKR